LISGSRLSPSVAREPAYGGATPPVLDGDDRQGQVAAEQRRESQEGAFQFRQRRPQRCRLHVALLVHRFNSLRPSF
jgi:hypothetical protein